MIISYVDTATEDIYNKRQTREAKDLLPLGLWGKAKRLLNYIDGPNCIQQLNDLPTVRLHRLTKDKHLIGLFAIRIDGKYRITFRYDSKSDKASDVSINNHYR
jgi:toxin HigB-1